MPQPQYDPIAYTYKCLMRYKHIIPILLLDMLFSALFAFVPSYIIKNIINAFSLFSNYDALINHVSFYIFLYFIFFIASMIIFRLWDYMIMVKALPSIKKDITVEHFFYLLHQTKDYFQKNFSGEISEKIDDLQENVVEIIKWFFNKILVHTLSIIITCGGLLYFNFECGVLIVSWIIFFGFFIYIFGKKISLIGAKWANDVSFLNGLIVDILSNFLVVKLFNNSYFERENISSQAEKIRKKESLIEWYFFICWTIYGFSFFIIQIASLYILFNQYKRGIVNQSDFAFVWSINSSIVNILWRFLRDFVEFPKYYSLIQQSLIIINQEITIISHNNLKLEFKEGKIEFKNVTFSFDNKIIFNKINLVIKPYQKIGLVGYSGSGKTTLINLILRLYDIDEGEILIDGQNIKQVSLDSLYKAINVIPQESLLFHRSILENLLYGDLNASKEELDKCIKLSALDKLIETLPDGYNTKVGEKGSRLSGGQKQRIAIARAYLKKASILILDEATSNLDSLTEDIIQKNLEGIIQQKTVLIIAHRLSTIEKMDRIIVFEKGEIVQDGTHSELIKQNGLYQNLWKFQSGLLNEE